MHGKWKEEQENRMKQQHALYEKVDEARQLRLQVLQGNTQARCASSLVLAILSSVSARTMPMQMHRPLVGAHCGQACTQSSTAQMRKCKFTAAVKTR